MIPRLTLVLLAAALACGCSNTPEEPTVPDPELPAVGSPTVDYDGPPVHATVETTDGEPPEVAVAVEIQVPTAGWELELLGVRKEDSAHVVELKLTEPGADELVAQVVQFKTARATLDASPQAVHVRVSRWQRGVQYLVSPDARLAVVVRP